MTEDAHNIALHGYRIENLEKNMGALTSNVLTLAAAGTTPFSVVVANAYGSATSSVATLTVTNLTPPPSIPTNQWYAVTNYLNGNAVSTNYYFNP